MTAPMVQQRRIDVGERAFSLRRVDPDRDADLVHSWMNDPEVARFWEMPWARPRIADYLRDQV
ncbi:MAG TPA: acetyltransferase, partial [Pseudonocardiaceae bacterium]